jgi:hypothetical protein
MFAVRKQVIDEMTKNPKYFKRMGECKNIRELQELIQEFCIQKSFKVKEVDL